jgi:DNA-binding CsgD family transcriptional regulator
MTETPPLVGRMTELDRLSHLAASAAEGGGEVLLLGGEGGIGKTSLVRHFLAAQPGRSVAWGTTPVPAGERLPYAPFSELLRGAAQLAAQDSDEAAVERAHLAAIVPAWSPRGVPTVEDPLARHRLHDAMRSMLERVAHDNPPLVIVLDDLQWADDASLALFSYLAHQLREAPVLLVAIYRSDQLEAEPALQRLLVELVRLDHVTHLELGGLPAEDLLTLPTESVQADRPDQLRAAARRAGGNPYYFAQLLRSDGEGTGELSRDLRDLLLRRTLMLGPPARTIAQIAAVAGRSATAGLLAAVVAGGASEANAGLRTLVRAGVLDQPAAAAMPYTFRQPLLQEAILADLLPDERAATHQLIALALQSNPSLISDGALGQVEVAIHWAAAPDGAPKQPALIAGAQAAHQMRAFELSHTFLEQALAIEQRRSSGSVGGAREVVAHLRMRAAEAAYLSGDPVRAVELARAAQRELAGDHREYLRLERLGWYEMAADDIDAALASLSRAANKAQQALNTGGAGVDDRARVLASYGRALMLAGHHEKARIALEEAVVRARDSGATADESRALTALGAVLVRLGRAAEGAASIEAGRRIDAEREASLAQPRPSRIGYLIGSMLERASVLEHIGQLEAATAETRQAFETARQLGGLGAWGEVIATRAAYEQFLLGNWLAADEAIGRASDGGRPADRAMRSVLRMRLSAARGQLPAALAAAADAEAALREGATAHVVGAFHLAEAEVALARGRPDDARDAVDRALVALAADDALDRAEVVSLGLRADAEIAAMASARRSGNETAAIREDALMLAAKAGLSSAASAADAASADRLTALRLLGEAELGRVHADNDAERWAVVASAFDALSEPYNAAIARWREAEALLVARRDRQRAEESLRSAHGQAVGLGADILRRECETLARRSRVTIGAGTQAPPADHGAPGEELGRLRAELGLSPRELEVLSLVADGRTNRQIADELFITQKTAGHHVSNILTKLGLSSRIEAAALAHRHGLTEHSAPS